MISIPDGDSDPVRNILASLAHLTPEKQVEALLGMLGERASFTSTLDLLSLKLMILTEWTVPRPDPIDRALLIIDGQLALREIMGHPGKSLWEQAGDKLKELGEE